MPLLLSSCHRYVQHTIIIIVTPPPPSQCHCCHPTTVVRMLLSSSYHHLPGSTSCRTLVPLSSICFNSHVACCMLLACICVACFVHVCCVYAPSVPGSTSCPTLMPVRIATIIATDATTQSCRNPMAATTQSCHNPMAVRIASWSECCRYVRDVGQGRDSVRGLHL